MKIKRDWKILVMKTVNQYHPYYKTLTKMNMKTI